MYSKNILTLHDKLTKQWKIRGAQTKLQGLAGLIEQNHSYNFNLWHAEDRARRDDMGAEYVYQAKRQIDEFNQLRNNTMESIDHWALKQYQPTDNPNCAIHSETPGMMIDRLSILCLKIFHMALQANRKDASSEHCKQCCEKLSVLKLQRQILARCLDELFIEVSQGNRRFIVYHQFKMYNDPNLNPELYNKKAHA